MTPSLVLLEAIQNVIGGDTSDGSIYFVLEFTSQTKLDEFLSAVGAVLPEHEQDGVCIQFPCKDMIGAESAKRKAAAIRTHFDNALNQLDFHKGWLAERLEYNDFGVSRYYISENGSIPKSPNDFKEVARAEFFQRALQVSLDDLSSSLFDYLASNTMGAVKNGLSVSCVRDAFYSANEILTGSSFLTANVNDKVFKLICKKAEWMLRDGLKVDLVADKLVKARSEIEWFERIAASMDLVKCHRVISEKFFEHFSFLEPRPKSHKVVNDGLLDLSCVPEGDIDYLLSPAYLCNKAGKNYDLKVQMISEGLASYYLTYLIARHEAGFKKLLLEASTQLDKKPFFERLRSLVLDSCPV